MKERISNRIDREKLRIKSLNDLLEAHNPLNVLKKGYTIVEDNEGKVISSKEDIKENDEIQIMFKDGKVKAKITNNM